MPLITDPPVCRPCAVGGYITFTVITPGRPGALLNAFVKQCVLLVSRFPVWCSTLNDPNETERDSNPYKVCCSTWLSYFAYAAKGGIEPPTHRSWRYAPRIHNSIQDVTTTALCCLEYSYPVYVYRSCSSFCLSAIFFKELLSLLWDSNPYFAFATGRL